MSEVRTLHVATDTARNALQFAGELCQRYQITALDDFQESCRSFAGDEMLNVAILGRFKAGKSSFLNHLFGRQFLPVGAVPVTTVVTEIEYGRDERAEVVFKNGRTEAIQSRRISEFVSETGNAENSKQVACVRVQLPAIERYRGIRFVDTPGLESVLEHNTEASLDWLPNVGLALVAVGVDPPLSQHDIELIRNLSRYTPNISLLLTKVDVLDDGARSQVQEFVQTQLARHCDRPVPIFPYSTRPGFEHLRTEIDQKLLSRALSETGEHHAAILRHKIDSLVRECAEYLTLALKASEAGDSERDGLRQRIVGEKQYLDDTRQALRLVARHEAATCRALFEEFLQKDELAVRRCLLNEFQQEFPSWRRSLRVAIERFDEWLCGAVTREMTGLANRHHAEFIEPIRRVSRQLSQSLQDFRNRLSERTLQALGIPLRTSEMELHVEDPRSPDVRVGKIFDRNWDLLSLFLPMWMICGVVRRHFERKVADVVFMNLSRLAGQWEAIVNASIAALEKEAVHRLDGLIGTIEKLIASAGQETPRIRADLLRLEELRDQL